MLLMLINLGQLTSGYSSLKLTLSLILFTALTMIIHEFGHLVAARFCRVRASEIGFGLGPRLCGIHFKEFVFTLRAFPIASFVRLDGAALEQCSVSQQVLVHLGGVSFNLVAATVAHGTLFGWLNLLLAAANLLPLYQHDGWKCGVVLMRALLRKRSQPVEWVFTFSGGCASLLIVASLIELLK